MSTDGSEEGILHADLDAFYASVEQRDEPSLRGRPVIVGGGVVLAASYEAKARGVRTAMPGRQARRLCPEAVVRSPRFEAYTAASRAVFAIFRDVTPVVEPLSIDEAFLDVSGLRRLRGPALPIAAALRDRVRVEVGLPISVGVARTTYLAKVASALSKPEGLLLVPRESELTFLHALPVERLWGVGDVTARSLHQARIRTVADIARTDEAELAAVIGPAAARHLSALAHGRDPRRVDPGVRRRSIGAQHALGPAVRSEREIETVLLGLVDTVSRRLRAGGLTARTVTLRWRFGDYRRATSSRTLRVPTHDTAQIARVAAALLGERSRDIRRDGLTLVGVALSGLDRHGAQLALPLEGEPDPRLDDALDAVRQRFGTSAVRRAVHVRE
ncbi:DNA polymerase IV [Aeromicrobium camelliae]|uniref:DNA polymerase IV n=1 Tax=Aeromicrobium camelliae TaxID=1538144 RepID=A0A3N6YWU6_9ACTN|nr:DNA polymerase IV [Aeromicrobium camelliae]RQN02211.1 DNA polymerase IV [Aeromicrobium camelliae]